MTKSITIHLSDESYNLIKSAAENSNKSLSNFVIYATKAFLSHEMFVDAEEMNKILNDVTLLEDIQKAQMDTEEGRYRIVE